MSGNVSGSGASGRRPRVLLVAEAANPVLYSVALIGWSFSRAMAEVADVHLASELRNRDAILAAGIGSMQFTPIDNRRWQGLAWRIAKMLRGGDGLGWGTYSALAALAYPFFEREVWRVFEKPLRAGEFDVVHRVTPNSPITSSLLAHRCARIGVPFVFGPINGGVPWPKEFRDLRKAEREWLSPFRRVVRCLPGFHATRRNASAILVGARCAWNEMPQAYRDKCVYLPENAIDPRRFPRQELPVSQVPVRVAFVGRLVPCKGVDMLLEAVSPLVLEGRLILDIIGDGPELPRLRQLTETLGLTAAVQFPGWVDHAQMAARLGQSSVFAFPSVREFGGGVVLEAMALGLVPVVIDYGGPGELVPPGGGFALPMGSRESIIERLRDALTQLAADPELVGRMGGVAQEHAYRLFTWEAKSQQVLEVYRWVMRERSEKPDFGVPLR